MKKHKNLIGLWVQLSRAYEIAWLGEFSIQVVFHKEYAQGYEDYKAIKSFYEGRSNVSFVADGDLIIEITKPDYNINTERCETLEDIAKRVIKAKKNAVPTEFNGSACEGLLKTATERLNFSLRTREKVIDISKIIAQLDGSDTIEAQHIAEAIQYKAWYPNGSVVAESKHLKFGPGISIAQFELDPSDVENAIKHLQNL